MVIIRVKHVTIPVKLWPFVWSLRHSLWCMVITSMKHFFVLKAAVLCTIRSRISKASHKATHRETPKLTFPLYASWNQVCDAFFRRRNPLCSATEGVVVSRIFMYDRMWGSTPGCCDAIWPSSFLHPWKCVRYHTIMICSTRSDHYDPHQKPKKCESSHKRKERKTAWILCLGKKACGRLRNNKKTNVSLPVTRKNSPLAAKRSDSVQGWVSDWPH